MSDEDERLHQLLAQREAEREARRESVHCDHCSWQADEYVVVRSYWDYYKHGAELVEQLWCLRCVRGEEREE